MSVTETLRPFVNARQQFTSLGEAWMQFVFFLRDRLGADIQGLQRMDEINAALDYLDRSTFDESNEGQPNSEWFASFECRMDVVAALDKFLRHRGLKV